MSCCVEKKSCCVEKKTVKIDDDATTTTHQNVQEYYGTTLQATEDLQTNACRAAGAPPKYIQACLKNIHPQVLAKYYGCGLCIPAYDLTGSSVLDLGCGAGRDVYVASQLVGPTGTVVGVDMTPQQIDTARQYQDEHAQRFGHASPNTQFIQGYLENLLDIPDLKPESFDVIISNCVLNLRVDKPAVLKACYRLLKPGGEMYFSGVYANRRVLEALQKDSVLWGECVSGALYWNDFINIAKQAGFADPRVVEDSTITLQNKKMQAVIAASGDLKFRSVTYRLFKIEGLEPACEDFGQAVMYKGTIQLDPNETAAVWALDRDHIFERGKIMPVCGNTYRMLHDNPRAATHFEFYGTWDRHYGIYQGCYKGCGASPKFDQDTMDTTTATESKGTGMGCC